MRQRIRKIIVMLIMITIMTINPQISTAHQIHKTACVHYSHHHIARFRRCWRWAQVHNCGHRVDHCIVLPWQLRLIRGCESGIGANPDSFDYRAQNRHSTASGAFQFLDSTWGGHRGYAKARLAPRWVQDEYALHVYNAARGGPWAQSRHCWG